ncbi:RNase H domain-containing protein [Trichonephila clavipes]|nr:RNase H domain-containing protein [Trichonephila clavipes]
MTGARGHGAIVYCLNSGNEVCRRVGIIDLRVRRPIDNREELLTSTTKHSSHPELLRQITLEVINDIPDQALIIYTGGSRSDTDRARSGIFSNTPGNDVKISIRISDHCSVFRSELIVLLVVLSVMRSTLIRTVSGS